MEDFGQSSVIDIHIVLSADVVVAIEMDTLSVVFTCWCSNVIGWTNYQSNDASAMPGR